jgi:hypothetical protein
LQKAGIGTILFDLLTSEEDHIYERRFDTDLLAQRLVGATCWLSASPELDGAAIGYSGARPGTAAALQGAALLGEAVKAVVSFRERPDLAIPWLVKVLTPTLLNVGELYTQMLQLNRQARSNLAVEKELGGVPGAIHLIEEPHSLEQVASPAKKWFARFLC